MIRSLVAGILLVSSIAAAAPPWSVAARVGGERTDVDLRRDEHYTEQRSGYSVELELEVEAMPRLAIAVFARDDSHTGEASQRFENVFVGMRAKVHIVPWLVAGAGLALVREHERSARDSAHSALGVELGLAGRLGPWGRLELEALLDFGRFTMTDFEFVQYSGNADWMRLSIALRFR